MSKIVFINLLNFSLGIGQPVKGCITFHRKLKGEDGIAATGENLKCTLPIQSKDSADQPIFSIVS